jgi:hypothetical protein
MKIRNGFVSNSSSSSFIVVCNPINKDDFDEDAFKEYCKTHNIWVLGQYLSEGYDFFELESKYLNLIDDNLDKMKFLEVIHQVNNDDNELVLTKQQLLDFALLDAITIKSIEVDYHETDNVDTFINRYINEY